MCRAQSHDLEAAATAATANGMALFAAAGDNSSSDGAPGANVDLPSACPHFVGCGGTTKTSFSEVVWGDGRPDGRGTGGGYSDIFAAQPWQIGAPPRTTPGPGGRMVPDVAANADPNTGYLVVVNGTETQIGGTSAVAPFYAGLFASFGKKLGWVTPTLWLNPGAFVDITAGSNGSYFAAAGPDPCTGLGVPNGARIAALFGASINPSDLTNFPNLKMVAAAGGPVGSICSVYATLKPILEAIVASPSFPADGKAPSAISARHGQHLQHGRGRGVALQANLTLDVQFQAVDSQVRSALASAPANATRRPRRSMPQASPAKFARSTGTIKPILDIIKTFGPPRGASRSN